MTYIELPQALDLVRSAISSEATGIALIGVLALGVGLGIGIWIGVAVWSWRRGVRKP